MEEKAEVVEMEMELWRWIWRRRLEMETGDVFLPEAWKVTGGSAAAVREITHIDPNIRDLLDLLEHSNVKTNFLFSPCWHSSKSFSH